MEIDTWNISSIILTIIISMQQFERRMEVLAINFTEAGGQCMILNIGMVWQLNN